MENYTRNHESEKASKTQYHHDAKNLVKQWQLGAAQFQSQGLGYLKGGASWFPFHFGPVFSVQEVDKTLQDLSLQSNSSLCLKFWLISELNLAFWDFLINLEQETILFLLSLPCKEGRILKLIFLVRNTELRYLLLRKEFLKRIANIKELGRAW